MDEPDILDVLNILIVTCKDGEHGFRRCARNARSDALRAFLEMRADACARAADELRGMSLLNGGTPRGVGRRGSATGAVQRAWLALKGTFAAPDDLAALDECARGEEAALARYREALDEPLPAPLRERIEQQYLGALRHRTLMRAWRGAGA